MTLFREIIDTILGKTTVQGVVALTLTAVFAYLAVQGVIPVEAFLVQFGFVTGYLYKSVNE